MRKFGKDKFWNCLRIFLVEEMRKFGKDKFWNCPVIFLVEEMRKFGEDKFWNCLVIFQWWGFWFEIMVRVKRNRVSPRGSKLVNWGERMNIMRVYGVFIYLYRVMAQSSDRPIGERLKIAVFAVVSFDWREEVRNCGFSDLFRFCG